MHRPPQDAESRLVIGWDVGGAHLKACLLRDGRVADVAQWPCPLWQGLDKLESALEQALARWPFAGEARHAVTMTGEMVDLFEHRQQGVERIAALIDAACPAPLFFAGAAHWCRAADVAAHRAEIASANWLATAQHSALAVGGSGVLVDIGSTTTDLIAFRDGRVGTTSRSDAERLASGELVYHGAVRTPLCALARRIPWRGRELNVMNEFFATTADVYRLTAELDPAHDLHPAADGGAKDTAATQRRLARMIGLDARDAGDAEWLAFAQAWRAAQVEEIAGQLRRVIAASGLRGSIAVVSAGCGAFLAQDVVAQAMDGAAAPRLLGYGRDIVRVATDSGTGSDAEATADWAQVCAPSVAVAALLDREQR
jgi:probable H4MPT-linked C1 transfer pathway protein